MSIGIAYNPCKNCKEMDKCSICELTYYRKGYIKSPTADGVEVVRCKECKHYKTSECAMWYKCSNRGGQWDWCNPNDCCSYGERREECKQL